MSIEAMKLALEYAKPSVISPGWTLVRNEDITALREALAQDVPEVGFGNMALDKMAENARELGLDYEPAQQEPIKQGWDVDTLLDKPIPLKDFYEPAQQEPVSFLDWYDNAHWGNEDFKAGCRRAWNAALAQRTWVGLTDEDKHYLNEVLNLQGRFPVIDAIEAKLKERNT